MSKIQSKSKKQVELEEDSSSEEEVQTKKQVKTNQPAAKAKAPAKKKVEESSEESSDEEIIKPAPKGKAAQKAEVKTAAKKPVVESSDEESEEETPKAKAKPATKAAPAAKGKKAVESSDEESEEEAPKAKKAPVQAKKPVKQESSDEESEEEAPKAKKAPVQTKKPAKEESEEEESEEEVKPVKTQAAAAQNGPADDGNYEVFVKGLPFAATEHDVREYFAPAGEIANVNLLKGPDGRSKGIAFVRYNDNAALTTALTYTNGDFGGRTILVEKTTPKGQRNDAGAQGGRGGFGGAAGGPAEYGPKSERDPNSCSIFVGNLSWGTDEYSLSAFFESCGAVQNVRIARDPEGKARGFGHVDFASPDAVEKAVAKAGQNLDGRPVRVDFATSKKQDGGNRGGFGGNRGGFGGRGGAPGGGRMNLAPEDADKKKGSISSFQGQKQKL